MYKKIFLALVCMAFLGCAHPVDFKKPDEFKYESKVTGNIGFYMSRELKQRMYYGRAASAGIANRWDVPVGQVVHDYAISYMKGGVESLKEEDAQDKASDYDAVIKITDISYTMGGQAAHSDITVAVVDRSGQKILEKKYHADGPSGFGRVFAGGAFAQKSAIRQSTHAVMENIFKEFMSDFRAAYKRGVN